MSIITLKSGKQLTPEQCSEASRLAADKNRPVVIESTEVPYLVVLSLSEVREIESKLHLMRVRRKSTGEFGIVITGDAQRRYAQSFSYSPEISKACYTVVLQDGSGSSYKEISDLFVEWDPDSIP